MADPTACNLEQSYILGPGVSKGQLGVCVNREGGIRGLAAHLGLRSVSGQLRFGVVRGEGVT